MSHVYDIRCDVRSQAESTGRSVKTFSRAACSPTASAPVSLVPGQLFAAAISRAKGLDADRPVGLTKVTLAQ